MADLEITIQQTESAVEQLRTVLDRTQVGLQKAEAAVHSAKRFQPLVMTLLAVGVAVGAAILAEWLARRLRHRNHS